MINLSEFGYPKSVAEIVPIMQKHPTPPENLDFLIPETRDPKYLNQIIEFFNRIVIELGGLQIATPYSPREYIKATIAFLKDPSLERHLESNQIFYEIMIRAVGFRDIYSTENPGEGAVAHIRRALKNKAIHLEKLLQLTNQEDSRKKGIGSVTFAEKEIRPLAKAYEDVLDSQLKYKGENLRKH